MTNNHIPYVLITNDDGVNAPGIKALWNVVKEFARVVVVAPEESHSGMSHAITVKYPVRIHKLQEEENLEVYSCSGTPVDGIKMALNKVVKRKPDVLLSGINHGSNSSISVIYSGTMAAAIEGCINRIPSIGFSYNDFTLQPDFRGFIPYVKKIVQKVLETGLPEEVCLNVNCPDLAYEKIKGVKVVRQTKGAWKEEFDHRTDPRKIDYFWLTGEFHNFEPQAKDTDEWALNNGYVSIVPVKTDLTAYHVMDKLQNTFLNEPNSIFKK